jgi:hypothetical protein
MLFWWWWMLVRMMIRISTLIWFIQQQIFVHLLMELKLLKGICHNQIKTFSFLCWRKWIFVFVFENDISPFFTFTKWIIWLCGFVDWFLFFCGWLFVLDYNRSWLQGELFQQSLQQRLLFQVGLVLNFTK